MRKKANDILYFSFALRDFAFLFCTDKVKRRSGRFYLVTFHIHNRKNPIFFPREKRFESAILKCIR